MKQEERDLSQEDLSTLTDQLNEVIGNFEKLLVRLDKGVPAQVQLPRGRTLHFMVRAGSGFKLMVEDDVGNSYPLLNSSRETRLRAVERFEELYRNLLGMHEEEKLRVVRATEWLQDYITKLEEENQ